MSAFYRYICLPVIITGAFVATWLWCSGEADSSPETFSRATEFTAFGLIMLVSGFIINLFWKKLKRRK
ncbi:hypothetical protein MLA66_004410 [Salmonella enterica]|nr:hypothetical protein [Salmonella enterica]EEM7113347.1 hypothetical protein [Salmonella enterica subsp. enterica serovar Poona]EAS9893660.1 hypothetical protein [Salmonella enterica]EEO3567711.1 hypothetical protein [Salmonella enterica subsp. enterica serovar Poona]EHZ8150417.1 hypothetical protein [Salmonella enterica]